MLRGWWGAFLRPPPVCRCGMQSARFVQRLKLAHIRNQLTSPACSSCFGTPPTVHSCPFELSVFSFISYIYYMSLEWCPPRSHRRLKRFALYTVRVLAYGDLELGLGLAAAALRHTPSRPRGLDFRKLELECQDASRHYPGAARQWVSTHARPQRSAPLLLIRFKFSA